MKILCICYLPPHPNTHTNTTTSAKTEQVNKKPTPYSFKIETIFLANIKGCNNVKAVDCCQSESDMSR